MQIDNIIIAYVKNKCLFMYCLSYSVCKSFYNRLIYIYANVCSIYQFYGICHVWKITVTICILFLNKTNVPIINFLKNLISIIMWCDMLKTCKLPLYKDQAQWTGLFCIIPASVICIRQCRVYFPHCHEYFRHCRIYSRHGQKQITPAPIGSCLPGGSKQTGGGILNKSLDKDVSRTINSYFCHFELILTDTLCWQRWSSCSWSDTYLSPWNIR